MAAHIENLEELPLTGISTAVNEIFEQATAHNPEITTTQKFNVAVLIGVAVSNTLHTNGVDLPWQNIVTDLAVCKGVNIEPLPARYTESESILLRRASGSISISPKHRKSPVGSTITLLDAIRTGAIVHNHS